MSLPHASLSAVSFFLFPFESAETGGGRIDVLIRSDSMPLDDASYRLVCNIFNVCTATPT